MDGLVPAEPGELPFGVVPGGLAHLVGGVGNIPLTVQGGYELFVADGLHGSAFGGDSAGKEGLDFLNQPHFQHFLYPQVDAVI